jgi:hypothetical protein
VIAFCVVWHSLVRFKNGPDGPPSPLGIIAASVIRLFLPTPLTDNLLTFNTIAREYVRNDLLESELAKSARTI